MLLEKAVEFLGDGSTLRKAAARGTLSNALGCRRTERRVTSC